MLLLSGQQSSFNSRYWHCIVNFQIPVCTGYFCNRFERHCTLLAYSGVLGVSGWLSTFFCSWQYDTLTGPYKYYVPSINCECHYCRHCTQSSTIDRIQIRALHLDFRSTPHKSSRLMLTAALTGFACKSRISYLPQLHRVPMRCTTFPCILNQICPRVSHEIW